MGPKKENEGEKGGGTNRGSTVAGEHGGVSGVQLEKKENGEEEKNERGKENERKRMKERE